MIRVLLADDHILFRRGLIELLAAVDDIVPAAEAGSGREVLRALQNGDYDVLLLDISMPAGGGLDVLPQIRAMAPGLGILVLTMYPEKQYARRALRSGADGYLTKDSSPDLLIEAIRTVADGRKYITPTIAEQLAEELAGERTLSSYEVLSDREYQVLRHLAAGKTPTDIADELSLSVKTVSTYRSRILHKLGLKSTADIIRFAFEHGLAE